MASFGLFSLYALLATIGGWLRGYTLKILWGWFIVTTLHLAPLTTAQALGFSLTFTFLRGVPTTGHDKRPRHEKVIEYAVGVIVQPLIFLLFGWIVKFFL